jgi:hypothetical protein
MIVIQIVLVAGFLYLLLSFLANPTSNQMRAWKKILVIGFTAVAIGAVLLPEKLNTIAHWFGVGRGADLLLYLLTLTFIIIVFDSYVKGQQDKKRLVIIARRLAILEANNRYKTR